MKTLGNILDHFFFQRISATGFGLMRCVWGASIFLWMGSMYQDVIRYFSYDGVITKEFYPLLFRNDYRFSVLDHFGSPEEVWVMYGLLMVFALFTCIGYMPRLFTTLTVLLFFSFQERNLLIMGGGDTVLRNVGFALLISPQLRAFSIDRAWDQWKSWQSEKKFLEPLTMSIWPYRLVLWQVLIIYVYTCLEKISGSMWLDGTAVEVFFHHPTYFRWSKEMADLLTIFSTFSAYFTVVWEMFWLLLLIPKPILEKFPKISYGSVKRGLMIGGIFFHGGLWVLSNVGAFPLGMATIYFGLLLQDDFDAIRTWLNKRMKNTIAILYDGKCGLCLRSVFWLKQTDWLHRLQPVNFHYAKLRKAAAPDLTFAELDKALHIVLPNRKTLAGFDALRAVCWHIPILWPLAPLLYIPGASVIGRPIYRYVAARRKKCTHENCAI